MQTLAFEAALRLINSGPAIQPLTRILGVAMDMADCPIGLIGVRDESSFRILVSIGMPLADFQPELKRSQAMADRLKKPCIIEDLSQDSVFALHPHVVGPANWHFMASAPLPLAMLPHDVLLICCDSRAGRTRRSNLLERMVECAAIAADELRLISDIAAQTEAIVEVRNTSELRDSSVRSSNVPMALVTGDGCIRVANAHLAARAGLPIVDLESRKLSSLFPNSEMEIESCLRLLFLPDAEPFTVPVQFGNTPDLTCQVNMIRVVSSDRSLPTALCTITDNNQRIGGALIGQPFEPDSQSVVTNFLMTTLIARRRLLNRGDVSYHALRRWRSTIKDSQLAALKALKGKPSETFVNAVARDLAAAALALYGKGTTQVVIAVPCGNSGPDCLAARIAPVVASLLGLPHIAAFGTLPPSGGSHPIGNTRRARMHLEIPVDRPVLLIDDVATSGAHIAEAAETLKRGGAPAVLPLVWLADA